MTRSKSEEKREGKKGDLVSKEVEDGGLSLFILLVVVVDDGASASVVGISVAACVDASGASEVGVGRVLEDETPLVREIGRIRRVTR